MKITPESIERVSKMSWSAVYPHYINKVTSKGRSLEELHTVIEWLTGFDEAKLDEMIRRNANLTTFFDEATLNPNASLIKGLICGYRIEEIEDPLMRKVRYLDKLIDELARGRKLEKILRSE